MQTKFTMTRVVTVEHGKPADKEALREMIADIYGDPGEGSCTGFDARCGGFDITLGAPNVKNRNKP
jgi:hypothetical protein